MKNISSASIRLYFMGCISFLQPTLKITLKESSKVRRNSWKRFVLVSEMPPKPLPFAQLSKAQKIASSSRTHDISRPREIFKLS